MVQYYPSEIARLVLGYLKEINCLKTWETFLVESIDLQEHYRLLQSGRPCSTNIEGKSLLDILNEYCDSKDAVKRNKNSKVNLNICHSRPSYIENANSSCSANLRAFEENNGKTIDSLKFYLTTPQTQSTAFFSQGGNQSPQTSTSSQTYLPIPTRSHSSRALSRLQKNEKLHARTLNFETGIKRNEKSISSHSVDFKIASRYASVQHSATNTIASQKLCFCDLKRKPIMVNRMVQTETSQIIVNNKSCQTSTDSPSHQIFSESISTEYSQQLPCSANSSNHSAKQQLISNAESNNFSSKVDMDEKLNNSKSLSENNLPENGSTSQIVVNNKSQQTSTDSFSHQRPDPHCNKSTVYQNTPTASNVEVSELIQLSSEETDLAQASWLEDAFNSCMPIVQSDANNQLQMCNLKENNNAAEKVNDGQSATSNVDERSTFVLSSVIENMTGLNDGSTLKPVSILTPFQVGSQVAVSQAACSTNQNISTSQANVCYPSSVTNSTMSLIPNNRNGPILPATANPNFILNSNHQTSSLVPFPCSAPPGFPAQTLDGSISRIIVIQPCPAHSINFANLTNNFTNDAIFPIQSASTNVSQTSITNSSPIKIPHDYSPTKSFLADNIGNFVTVTSSK